MIPSNVKERAQELYLKGDRVSTISKALTQAFDYPIKTATIYSWIRKENWPSMRGELKLQVNSEMAEIVKDQLISASNKHSEAYQALWGKASVALDLENPASQITFTKTSDAVKALDIGIQGERKVQQGLVNTQLIMKIYGIISEEIADEVALKRIAVKFRVLAEEVSSM